MFVFVIQGCRVAELWKDVRGKDGHNVVQNISGRNG